MKNANITNEVPVFRGYTFFIIIFWRFQQIDKQVKKTIYYYSFCWSRV